MTLFVVTIHSIDVSQNQVRYFQFVSFWMRIKQFQNGCQDTLPEVRPCVIGSRVNCENAGADLNERPCISRHAKTVLNDIANQLIGKIRSWKLFMLRIVLKHSIK